MEGDGVELFGVGILFRVGIVNAVDHSRLHYYVSLYLNSAKSGGCIGAEERVARAAAEDDHSALVKMSYSLVADIRLRDLTHVDSGLHPNVYPKLLQSVANAERVDSRSEHSHVIGASSVHIAGRSSAPEVASAYNDSDFHSGIDAFFDRLADFQQKVKVDTVLQLTRERLARKLQKYSFIFRLHT